MTKTKAKKWLEAVRHLAAYYRGEHDECYRHCLLCKAAKGHCSCCLWVLFSKMECTVYRHRYFPRYDPEYDIVNLRRSRQPHWVKLSLARLKRWEKRLVEIIEEIDDMKSRQGIFLKNA